MIKRVILLILVMYSIPIVVSCVKNEYKVMWTGFDIRIIDTSENEKTVIVIGNIVNKNTFGIEIFMEGINIDVTNKDFGIIAECKAATNSFRRGHSMCSITIKTLYDYSDNYPSGSDITSLFKVGKIYLSRYQDDKNISTIDELIYATKNISRTVSYDWFDLHLMDNSCVGGQQKFEITIILSDETVLVRQTNNLIME